MPMVTWVEVFAFVTMLCAVIAIAKKKQRSLFGDDSATFVEVYQTSGETYARVWLSC